VTFNPALMMPKHSCFANKLQHYYNVLCASGLGNKWYKDFTESKKWQEHVGPRKLAVEHIQGFLYLWAFRCCMALVTFICEILFATGFKKFNNGNRDNIENEGTAYA